MNSSFGHIDPGGVHPAHRHCGPSSCNNTVNEFLGLNNSVSIFINLTRKLLLANLTLPNSTNVSLSHRRTFPDTNS